MCVCVCVCVCICVLSLFVVSSVMAVMETKYNVRYSNEACEEIFTCGMDRDIDIYDVIEIPQVHKSIYRLARCRHNYGKRAYIHVNIYITLQVL